MTDIVQNPSFDPDLFRSVLDAALRSHAGPFKIPAGWSVQDARLLVQHYHYPDAPAEKAEGAYLTIELRIEPTNQE